MIITYSLLGALLLCGAAYTCLIQQKKAQLPQEILLEQLTDKH